MGRAKAVACLIGLVAAGCSPARRLVVGSKNFTEQNILGEILAQQIERKLKVPVERKLNLQGTLLAQEALEQGAIDLYPEYTGTALTAILKLPLERDPAAVLARVRAEYERRWRLVWLQPLGFNDTFAMVVRGETARGDRIRTLSEAARRPWTLGVGYEFLQRPDGLEGLVKTYGLRMRSQPVTMDLGLLYRALEERKVDLIAANSTDGRLAMLDVVALEDDRRYFPPYQCAVVAREGALAEFRGLREALAELAVGDAEMRRMNYEVEGKHRRPAEVAREFLDRGPKL
jgi:osmoprotectant transport system substrate-binding protein